MLDRLSFDELSSIASFIEDESFVYTFGYVFPLLNKEVNALLNNAEKSEQLWQNCLDRFSIVNDDDNSSIDRFKQWYLSRWDSDGYCVHIPSTSGLHEDIFSTQLVSKLSTTSITFEAWVFSDQSLLSAALPPSIFTISNTSWTKGLGLYTVFGTNNPIEYRFCVNEWDLDYSVYSGVTTATDANWTHLAGTFDGQTLKLYVNGELVNSLDSQKTIDYETDVNNGYWLSIGTSHWDSTDSTYAMWPGSIAECRIWNVARTQQQIKLHMNKKMTGREVGLALYLPLNDLTFTTSDGIQLAPFDPQSSNPQLRSITDYL
jgi:hypothetical protein